MLVAGGEIQASIVPIACREAPFPIAEDRVREVDRRFKGRAAVARSCEQDLAAMRPPGEHDFLPKNEDVTRVTRADEDSRKPGKHPWRSGDVYGPVEPRVTGRIENLEKNVLAGLVHPGNTDNAVAVDRDRRIVDVVIDRPVHAPGAS